MGAGGGYGMWDQENTLFTSVAPRTQITDTFTAGGRGYFGTVQGGCDYQFGGMGRQFLVGAFGDYDFSSFTGKLDPPGIGIVGDEKMSSAWSVGGRVGWVVVPRFLTYFSAGYTEATFDRTNFTVIGGPPFGVAAGLFQDRRTYRGYFVGAGDEYALGFLPGLFWKTEYRFSEFNTASNPIRDVVTGLAPAGSDDFQEMGPHRPQRVGLSLQLG